ncbi:MAG: hypothetical protein R2882_12720 [Gemmatimonadales bacterium]
MPAMNLDGQARLRRPSHDPRGPLRHSGPARLPRPARGHRPRRPASHGTLFVEPTAAIEFGNALRSAVVAAERELLKVLRELTELLRPLATRSRRPTRCAWPATICWPGPRYAHAVKATPPAIGGGELTLVAARHPLLLARGLEVVPFELSLDPEERTS